MDTGLTKDTGLSAERNCTVTREECDVQFIDVFDQIKADAGGNPITVVYRSVLAQRR